MMKGQRLFRNLNIVRMVYDKGPFLIHVSDTDGDQPLHNAARGVTQRVLWLALARKVLSAVTPIHASRRLLCSSSLSCDLVQLLALV
jgi:hypothetical protein